MDHQRPETIHFLAGYSGLLESSKESPNYHYDSMAPGGPTVHVSEAPDSWVPLEIASRARLALRSSFPGIDGDLLVDTQYRKGDTLDR
jgi:hypothetical protein